VYIADLVLHHIPDLLFVFKYFLIMSGFEFVQLVDLTLKDCEGLSKALQI
jgi:hypothetical protein